MKEVTDFKKEVLQAKGLTVVDFWADWCGPCVKLSPILEDLSKEMPDITFMKVNVDKNHDLASEYQITGIPAVMLFKDDKLVDKFVGLLPLDQIKEILQRHV